MHTVAMLKWLLLAWIFFLQLNAQAESTPDKSLEEIEQALASDDLVQWVESMDSLMQRIRTPVAKGDAERISTSLLALHNRKELPITIKLTVSKANMIGNWVPSAKKAVVEWHKTKTPANTLSVQLSRHDTAMMLLIFLEAVPREQVAVFKSMAQTFVSGLKVDDGLGLDSVAGIVRSYGLSDQGSINGLVQLLSKDVLARDAQNLALHLAEPRLHNILFDIFSASERLDYAVLAVLQPDTERATKLISMAYDLLNAEQFDEMISKHPSKMALIAHVLKNPKTFRDKLAHEQFEKLSGILERKTASTIQKNLVLWIALLYRDHAAVRRFLSEIANSRILTLGQWTQWMDFAQRRKTAKPQTQNLDAQMETKVHGLWLFSVLGDNKISSETRQALSLFCQPPIDGGLIELWERQPAKVWIDRLAAFSILFQTATEPTEIPLKSDLGQRIRSEHVEVDWKNVSYALIFAGERLGGDVPFEQLKLPPKQSWPDRLRLAACFGDEQQAAQAFGEALKDTHGRWHVIEPLYLYRNRLKSIRKLPGLKDELLKIQKESGNVATSKTAMQCAWIMWAVLEDKDAALDWATVQFKQQCMQDWPLSGGWIPVLELVLAMDTRSQLLDQFRDRISGMQLLGKDFILWLLSLRRGEPVGEFPMAAFLEAREAYYFPQLLCAFSRADKAAVPYLKQLRNIDALQGCFSIGIDHAADSRELSQKAIAYQALIDRLAWLEKGLPFVIPPGWSNRLRTKNP